MGAGENGGAGAFFAGPTAQLCVRSVRQGEGVIIGQYAAARASGSGTVEISKALVRRQAAVPYSSNSTLF
jgi:hypothetical protein